MLAVSLSSLITGKQDDIEDEEVAAVELPTKEESPVTDDKPQLSR